MDEVLITNDIILCAAALQPPYRAAVSLYLTKFYVACVQTKCPRRSNLGAVLNRSMASRSPLGRPSRRPEGEFYQRLKNNRQSALPLRFWRVTNAVREPTSTTSLTYTPIVYTIIETPAFTRLWPDYWTEDERGEFVAITTA